MRGAILLLLVSPFPADASRVEISPTLLELGPERPTAVLQLRNSSDVTVDFEVLAFAWDQDEENDVHLTETREIVFFPAMVSVEPGKVRKVRVAAQTPLEKTEKAYRLLLKQLPPRSAPEGGTAVHILTEFLVPVFAGHAGIRPAPELAVVRSEGQRVELKLRNAGQRRLQPFPMEVRVLDEAGSTLHSAEIHGWYVLPGREKSYTVQLPENACPTAHRVVVRAEFVDAPAREVSSAHRCSP